MGKYAEQAVINHKNYYSCSAAVLAAFAREAGLSEEEALKTARPFASGRQGKCGAVLAAETVLKNRYGKRADELIRELEQTFIDTGKVSVQCRDLIGSCRSCVRDSALVLETILEREESK